MSIWQGIIASMLLAAFLSGRPHWRIVAVMACNFLFSMQFGGNFLTVGVADVVSAAFLLGISARANVVAGLFALMVPVYVAGTYFQWNISTTYTIIDLIAYMQCGVIGRVDGGMGFIRRSFNRRRGDTAPRYLSGRRVEEVNQVGDMQTNWKVI